MTIRIIPYDHAIEKKWQDFVGGCLNGVFFHRRDFLSYHGDRFHDGSLLIYDDDTLVALLPASQDTNDKEKIISHGGITFGGLLHHGYARGENNLLIFESILNHYRHQGYKKFIYKAIPHIYHQAPMQDDLYSLFRLNAERVRCDLSATIDLACYQSLRSQRRIRSIKKSIKEGIMVKTHDDKKSLTDYWQIVTENLQQKYNAEPTHNLAEITLLMERFPEHIFLSTAHDDKNNMLAGVIFFDSPMVRHCQYIASNDRGRALSALDLVMEQGIAGAIEKKQRWFDFGISCEQQGRVLNNNLYKYKTEFGAGGVVHEFYEVLL